MRHRLRIPARQLAYYSDRYAPRAEPSLEHITRAAKALGFLTRTQLYEVAHWKSERRAGLVKANPEPFVREITAFSFAATHEFSRIGILTLLEGIHYPTASVVLHFCVDDSYPILDYRALWSLGIDRPAAYNPDFWVAYVEVCRALAAKHDLTVRALDKALWQYSREHQRDA